MTKGAPFFSKGGGPGCNRTPAPWASPPLNLWSLRSILISATTMKGFPVTAPGGCMILSCRLYDRSYKIISVCINFTHHFSSYHHVWMNHMRLSSVDIRYSGSWPSETVGHMFGFLEWTMISCDFYRSSVETNSRSSVQFSRFSTRRFEVRIVASTRHCRSYLFMFLNRS